MEILIHTKSKQDIKLFQEIADRLGLKTAQFSTEEKEDIGLARAIEEGIRSGFTTEKAILKTLQKVKGKK
jgi:hypothetical protein